MKKLKVKELHEESVFVSGTITSFIMNNMVESMVRANIPDEDIFDAIELTKKRVQLLERVSPDNLSTEMVSESLLMMTRYTQGWLDECRVEMEQEKDAA